MIILCDARIIEVDKDWHEIMRMAPGEGLEFTRDGLQEVNDVELIKEMIRGVRFLRQGPDPVDLYMGCDQSVTDLIGLQFETWENMSQELSRYMERALQSERRYTQVLKSLEQQEKNYATMTRKFFEARELLKKEKSRLDMMFKLWTVTMLALASTFILWV